VVAVSSHALQFVPATSGELTYIGRTYASGSGFTVLGWAGIQIAAQISDSSTLVLSFSVSGDAYLDVLVNGALISIIHLSQATANYTINYNFTSGSELWIVKRTEAAVGVLTFYGLYVSDGATVARSVRPARRMEFVGDSITCGYGNNGVAPCDFTDETENARVSHGAVAAFFLNADYMLTCFSGFGVVRNFGEPGKVSADALPSFYHNKVPLQNAYGVWNFTEWIPQALVINLGTNDFSAPGTTKELYTAAYVSFIAQIRSAYKIAPPEIFLACGPMSQVYCADIAVVAKQTGAHLIPAIPIIQGAEIGCAGHPSILGDKNMGSIETEFIKATMNW